MAVIICGVLAVCLGVPVAFIAVPIIRDTLAASRGSDSPQGALLSYVLTFEPPAESKRLDAERYIVGSHRKTMLKQRADYVGAIEATVAAGAGGQGGERRLGAVGAGGGVSGDDGHGVAQGVAPDPRRRGRGRQHVGEPGVSQAWPRPPSRPGAASGAGEGGDDRARCAAYRRTGGTAVRP
ncbi:hypothetical protein ACFFX1_17480 [Dactylosporangium sucinum]|uniref:hypothetical protein n=1 Tax=Dactylosporangium sucinum TaxID=1424081 RepID=UPI00167EECE8